MYIFELQELFFFVCLNLKKKFKYSYQSVKHTVGYYRFSTIYLQIATWG